MSDSSPPPDTTVTPPPDSSSSSPPPPDTTVTSPPPDSSTITPPPPASSTVTAPPPSSTVTPPPPDSSTLTPPPTSSDASPPPPTITPLPPLLSPPPAPSAPPPTASVTPPPPTDTTASPPPSTVTSPPPPSTVVSPPPPSATPSTPAPPPTATPSTPAPPPTSTTASPPPPITPPPPGTLPSPPPPPASLLSPPPPSSTNSSTPTPTTPSTTPSPPGGSTPLAPPPPPTYSSPSPSSGGLPPGAAAAVGVVVAAFVLAFIGLFVCYTRKRRRPNTEGYQQGYPNGFGMPNSAQFSPQQMSGEAPFLMSSPSRAMSGNHSGGPNGSRRYSSGPYNSGGPNYTNSKNYSAGSQGSKITDLNVGSSQLSFGYDELYEITGGFAKDNILGEGGFGCVYKGKLADGKEVAVKELKGGGGQGEREFQAEVEIISRVHHRHLVSLVGFCIADNHRLLVYDFVSNGTLHYHIHGKRGSCMEWSTRVRVAAGSARGLAYLHEDCHPKVIHRDIKSANILIDDHFEAQVADFGLARPTDTNATHVSTRVMGTFGYLAPEYASTGKLTEKSDVFSFGVVLLELTTGRKPVDGNRPVGEESLVEWARPLLNQALESEDHDFKELVDPNLGTNYKEVEMFRMIETAAACIRHSASRRPKMSQVVRVLDSLTDEVDISNGVQPGKSQMFNVANTVDIRLFQKMAFGSQEFSSEYSHTRSESNLSSRNF